jgi:hypothetical protein
MRKEKQIEEIFRDLCNAPTGGVREDFTIRTLTESHSDAFIRIVAGHLASLNYHKQSEGEWVRPPCYIGQEIWHITKHYDGLIEIRRGKVSMLLQKADKSWKIRITVNSSVWDFTPNEIGTEYFFSKEEAERALKGGEG